MSEMHPSLLELRNIDVFYQSVHAVRDVSLKVAEGSIVTLIGANGAGKSTTLNAISGVLPVTQGEIRLNGRKIDNLLAHAVARLGISQVPEGRRIFGRLTVAENLTMGAYSRNDKKEVHQDRERILCLFPRLRERLTQVAGTLSGGEQQMVVIGRALMARPSILLLDEPSMGLAPKLVDQIFETICEIRRQGTTVLLIEQSAYMALEIADYAYVLASGSIVLAGTGQELLRHEQVISAYLGEE